MEEKLSDRYYSHDFHMRSDPKIAELESRFEDNNDECKAYGVIQKIIEQLHCENNVIKKNDKSLSILALTFNINKDFFMKVIEISLEIGLLIEKDGLLSSNRVERNLEAIRTNSSKQSHRAKKGWETRRNKE